MKGYLRGINNYYYYFFLIGVVRYFSCCQRFDICVFTGLHFISASLQLKVMYLSVGSRGGFKGSLLFVTYTIIQGIIGSEMLVGTGPLNGKCKKEK